jgi:hypothetical protein
LDQTKRRAKNSTMVRHFQPSARYVAKHLVSKSPA